MSSHLNKPLVWWLKGFPLLLTSRNKNSSSAQDVQQWREKNAPVPPRERKGKGEKATKTLKKKGWENVEISVPWMNFPEEPGILVHVEALVGSTEL